MTQNELPCFDGLNSDGQSALRFVVRSAMATTSYEPIIKLNREYLDGLTLKPGAKHELQEMVTRFVVGLRNLQSHDAFRWSHALNTISSMIDDFIGITRFTGETSGEIPLEFNPQVFDEQPHSRTCSQLIIYRKGGYLYHLSIPGLAWEILYPTLDEADRAGLVWYMLWREAVRINAVRSGLRSKLFLIGFPTTS